MLSKQNSQVIDNKDNLKSVTFNYVGGSITISITGDKKIKDMIQMFLDKFNPNAKIYNYVYNFGGRRINPYTYDQTIEENKDFGDPSVTKVNISVQKNIHIIKCPKCNYDDCVINIGGYKTIFYNCEHFHLQGSSYDNYFTDQIFYPEKILCSNPGCPENELTDPNFKMCLTCSELLNRTKSICSKCISNHHKQYRDGKEHKIINYDDKNYSCKVHVKDMIKYCFKHKQSLCEDCEKDHKDHTDKIKSIDLLVPEKEEIQKIKNDLKEIQLNIESLRIIIDDLKYTLGRALDLYQNYYDIGSDIMYKFESFNEPEGSYRDFTIFKSLRNLRISNEQILKEINQIKAGKDKIQKAGKLIGIYQKKKNDYFIPVNEDDLNVEDDSEWFYEVMEREKKRLKGSEKIVVEQKEGNVGKKEKKKKKIENKSPY